MRTKFAFLSALLLLFMGQLAFSQVTGKVQDDFGPVVDAEVTVRGGTATATTDDDGVFSIDAKVGDVLVITDAMGTSDEVNVTKNNMGTITMGALVLEETVIQGAYDRTTTKKETVGAETVLDAATFENRPTSSFLNAIQGHAPGVVIQSNSGSPGSGQIDVLIRGRGSINASTDPLVVVDGIPMGTTQFRNLNQDDFESVTILRDAHATSIYGNRGANGVILITTKKGKAGVPLSIEVNSMFGFFTLPKTKYKMANAQEMLQIQHNRGLGQGASMTQEEINNWDGPNTNWRDIFFRTGINESYMVSMRQGSETFRSYYSVGYNKVEGMIPTTDFQRFTARANLSGNSENKRFTYEGILNVSYSKRHELDAETNPNISNNVIQNPLFGALMGLPFLDPLLDVTGRDLYWVTNNTPGYWAYVLKDVVTPGMVPNLRTEQGVLGSFAAGYELMPGLTARNKIGIDYKYSERVFARAPWSWLATAVAESDNLDFPGFEDHTNVIDATISNVASLNYNKTWGLHNLQLGAYFEYIKFHYRSNGFRQRGLVEATWHFNSGSGWAPRDGDLYVPEVFGDYVNAGSLSYFGTVEYEYDGKYGVAGTVRRDATNKFRKNKKWGTFWSAAARWVISEEEFMKDSAFNLLKLRGSYGVTGNQILTSPAYNVNPLYYDNSLAWDFYTSGDGYQNTGAYFPVLGNIDVGWEETHQANIGLDFLVFKNRLEGNLDVYRKDTKKLYTDINLSATTGQYDIDGNNGKLRNEGVELALRYKALNHQDYSLTFWANTSYNKNKILKMPSESPNPGGVGLAEGRMAFEFNLIPYMGVDPETGEYLYMDHEGNIVDWTQIDTERDARWTGKSLLPKWVGGFGFDVEYKGFYLDVAFSYQLEYYKWDNLYWWLWDSSSAVDMNLTSHLLDAWTPENPNTGVAALLANDAFDGDSDRLLYDAGFLRLRNATLGYNVPKKFLEGTFVKKANVFVTGENLAIWTKWKGYDPEGQVNYTLGQYPNPRVISVGLNLEF